MFVTAYPFAVAGAVFVLVRSRLSVARGTMFVTVYPDCCCPGRVCTGAFPFECCRGTMFVTAYPFAVAGAVFVLVRSH